MKVIFLILSLFVFASCGENPEAIEEDRTATNEVIIDSILLESKNWKDSTEQIIEKLGNKLTQPYKFYSLGNKYDPNSIYITTSDSSNFEDLEKQLTTAETDVKSFGAYKVYFLNRDEPPNIRYSIRPHPVLNWVMSIEKVY